jgi:catechol 2,3-dioxygenase-like lactoylglutathione lyase family enzyme
MAITHLQLFSLPISDPDRSKAFYVDTLGFTLLADTEMDGMRWLQVRPGTGQTSITLVTWFPTMPAGSTKGTVLETDDLEGDIERLRAHGVVIEGDPEQVPWGRFVTFNDPDGNGLVLQATAT